VLIHGHGELDEGGTRAFEMPPNQAIATHRIGTFEPVAGEEGEERPQP
jgi:hypothetical protein